MAASNARAEAAADPAARDLVITRLFDAPREMVFRAWTEPRQAMQWWAPEGFAVTALEMDVRPGGSWRKCMRSPDGREFWRRGVYCEVMAPERLVFTYVSDDPLGAPGRETLVTMTFAAQGDKTLMTLRHGDFDTPASRDSHLGGWASCIERLARYMTPTS